MKRLLIATIATAITGCGPAMWTDCYPAEEAFDGIELNGQLFSLAWCNDSCNEWAYTIEDDVVYPAVVTIAHDADPYICVTMTYAAVRP